jgi:hypothetical protein
MRSTRRYGWSGIADLRVVRFRLKCPVRGRVSALRRSRRINLHVLWRMVAASDILYNGRAAAKQADAVRRQEEDLRRDSINSGWTSRGCSSRRFVAQSAQPPPHRLGPRSRQVAGLSGDSDRFLIKD